LAHPWAKPLCMPDRARRPCPCRTTRIRQGRACAGLPAPWHALYILISQASGEERSEGPRMCALPAPSPSGADTHAHTQHTFTCTHAWTHTHMDAPVHTHTHPSTHALKHAHKYTRIHSP